MTRFRSLQWWSEVAVRVGLYSALVGAAALFVFALVTWPARTGIACSYLAVFVSGLVVRDQRRKLLAFSHHFLGEEVEAVHGADLDADVARERALRLSGDTPVVEVEPFMADSGYRPPMAAADEPDYGGWANSVSLPDAPKAIGWGKEHEANRRLD